MNTNILKRELQGAAALIKTVLLSGDDCDLISPDLVFEALERRSYLLKVIHDRLELAARMADELEVAA